MCRFIVGLDGTTQTNLLPYSANRWIKFRFVIRTSKKTYDLYIDDVLKARNYQFYADQCEVFSFFSWSSVEQQGVIFFDEIKLYSGSLSSQHEADLREQYRISPNSFDEHLSIQAGEALWGTPFTIVDLSTLLRKSQDSEAVCPPSLP